MMVFEINYKRGYVKIRPIMGLKYSSHIEVQSASALKSDL